MDYYINWVMNNPLGSAAIQFAILGSLGEIISASFKSKKVALPCTIYQMAGKILAWALLGIIIKYGFIGMKGFTRTLIEHQLLPAFCSSGLGWSFSVSVLTNLFFGPQMMFFHRLEDNLILLCHSCHVFIHSLLYRYLRYRRVIARMGRSYY